MEKSVAALMIAMVVSVMGIPLAYLAGQGSAQAALKEELERSRSNQDEAIATMKAELAEMERRQLGSDSTTTRAAEPRSQNEIPAPPGAIEFTIFEALTIGMDYEQIAKVLGRNGTRTLNIVDEDGAVTEQFVWDWINPKGKRGKIDLSFYRGKLQEKNYKE